MIKMAEENNGWLDSVPVASARCRNDEDMCKVHFIRQQPDKGTVEVAMDIPKDDVLGNTNLDKEMHLQEMLGLSTLDVEVNRIKNM